MSRTPDRYSLDRIPSKGEVIAGILACVVLVLVGGAILVFLIHFSVHLGDDSGGAALAYVIGAALGGLGLYVLMRIFFTSPQKPSKRAQHIASLAIGFGILVAVVVRLASLVWH